MPHIAQTLLLEGQDAVSFAQCQFSTDVAALADGQWQFSAWLNAQGRVRMLCHLVRLQAQQLFLLLRGGDANTLSAALQRFVFRARVRITASTTHMLACGSAHALYGSRREGDVVVIGCGDHSLIVGQNFSGSDGWCRMQLDQGWAWLPDMLLEKLLPPALSLHRLSAVSLDKGCYPGQEVVARMHYRGRHKRHLHRVSMAQVLESGASLKTADGELVQLLQVMPGAQPAVALAVLPDTLVSGLSSIHNMFTVNGVQFCLEASWGD